jgi:dolichol-phosphate mannosyltransferase
VISIVIPLFNEVENVEALQQELAAALAGHEHEIVLVDDGSTDGTPERIRARPGLRLLRFERNAGQSAALYAGIMAATGEVIVLLDGDLQNDPRDIPRLLEGIQSGADLVCGYRARRQDSLAKKISSRVANFVRSRFTGDGVRDTGCTLKAMRRPCRDALVPFKGMHRFIPALVKSAGFQLLEIPVHHRPRVHGQSKYGFGSRVFKATADMFGVRWIISRRLQYRVRENSPS